MRETDREFSRVMRASGIEGAAKAVANEQPSQVGGLFPLELKAENPPGWSWTPAR